MCLVRHNETQELFVRKSIRKDKILLRNQTANIRMERKLLQDNGSPFLMKLEHLFVDKFRIYFDMKYIKPGSLLYVLRKQPDKRLPEIAVKCIAAQLVLAIEYLQGLDITYCDLKPANVLIQDNGYILLTDFGLCKVQQDSLLESASGTDCYKAPEMIAYENGYDKCVDWWALGVL